MQVMRGGLLGLGGISREFEDGDRMGSLGGRGIWWDVCGVCVGGGQTQQQKEAQDKNLHKNMSESFGCEDAGRFWPVVGDG